MKIKILVIPFSIILVIISFLIFMYYDAFDRFYNGDNYIEMDDFLITAYCPGKCCNDKWLYVTSSGKSMGYYISLGYNIAAVDPKIIPIGAKFIYNNVVYTAVDIGGAIKGRHIDILLNTHEETVKFGRREKQKIKIKKKYF